MTNALRIAAPIAAAALLMPGAAAVDAPSEPIPLFDGETLKGWEATDFYKAGAVSVDDGAIVMAPSDARGGMTGITSTRSDLPTTDYELVFEARRTSGRDFFAAATFPVGDGFLTLVNGGWGGSITGLSSINGMDASENETGTTFDYENGTWYRFRILVTDRAVRCSIDDEEIIALDPEGRDLGTRLEVRSNQPLGFASWESGGELRLVTLRRLTPDEADAVAPVDP